MKVKSILSNVCLVLRYYIRYVPGLFWGQILFTIFVSAVWTLQGPVTTKYLLDALMEGRPIKEVLIFLCGVTLIVIARHVFACYEVEYLQTVADITIREKLLKEIHRKASEMDLEYYETPEFYNDYVWAAQKATVQFGQIFGSFITLTARLSELLFMGGVMAVLDPALLFFAAAMGVIRFAAQRRTIAIRYEANTEAMPVEREIGYARRVFYLNEFAKEIRLSRIHEVIYDKFHHANARLDGIWKKHGRRLFGVMACANLGDQTFGTLGMYSYLAYGVLVTRKLTFGDFSALSQSASRFASRLRQVLQIMLDFAEQSLYVDKFRRFMDYAPKIEKQKGALPEKEPAPLVLKNVSFTYNGESTPSLKNVNMTIRPHEKVAVVGVNGAGKTTLIKLLMRLYDPGEGEILLGGRNIREFDTESYRREFAVVFQDYQIFAATLGENVAMDETREEDSERIVRALCQGNFQEKLEELPLGIGTPLTKEFEKNGVELSGGERQKVAVARAFFRDSRFAVMDEPSSALDPIAEYRLNQNMMEIAKHRTVIFISHRLSTTVMADRIYLFEKGEIIEEGSHRELMARNGKYAEMFRKQAENYSQETA